MAYSIDFLPSDESGTFGILAVHAEYMSYDRPEIEHIWYAIGSFRKYHIEHHIGREVTPTANGRYIFSGGMGNPVYYDLEGGGKTKSCKREVIRVPKPKTRVETRWYRGHWQKYLKSKGWVAA